MLKWYLKVKIFKIQEKWKYKHVLYFKAKKIFGWLGLSEADQARWHIFSFEEPSIKRQAIFEIVLC